MATYGFLGYPLLQSADILIYQPDFVPVGQDQVAHVELTREVARRFNQFYPPFGAKNDAKTPPVLPEPKVLLTPSPKLPGTDGRKMSKSYDNTIELTDPEAGSSQKDEDHGHGPCAHSPHRSRRSRSLPRGRPAQGLLQRRRQSQKFTKAADQRALAASNVRVGQPTPSLPQLAPLQERRKRYEADPNLVKIILRDGEKRATDRAEQTMREVRQAMQLMAAGETGE